MNIEISLETSRRLKKIMKQDETFELVIRRLLKKWESIKSSPLSTAPRQKPIKQSRIKGRVRKFGAKESIPAAFTKITSAELNGKKPKSLHWNPLVELLLVIISKKGIEIDNDIHPAVRVDHITRQDQGYRPCYELGLSIQGVSASTATQIIRDLAKEYDISVDIQFFWRFDGNASFPGDSGHFMIKK